MPIRRGMGGLSSGAGGNLFDRPGFFDNSQIVNLTVETQLILKAASETYGIEITHAEQSADRVLNIPALAANGDLVITNATQTLTNKTIGDLRLPAIYDSNGNEIFLFTATSSAINEITLANAATSNPPVFSATGGDTNIDIKLQPKGSGKVHITGGLQVDGTTTTIDSTTLTVDDKNIEMGSVASPSDSTADGGGITLKGATDKTIIWDNTNDNWTSNQDWNIASSKSFKINNAVTLNATTLGSAVVTSSLTTVGTLGSGAISSGFGAIDIGTSALSAGALTVDNISIDGNTISSSSGNITFNAASSLDFGDDSVLNVGTITLDAIHGDNNAIQVGDNSDDAVSIYRVNALTAIGDLDIGAHDLRAATITSDGLTAGQVVYTGTAGILSAESGFEYNASSNTLTVNTITPTTINAFTLGGKLTAGSSEIEGSAFDIDGGAIDGVTIGTNAVATDVRVDNLQLDGNTISSTDSNGHVIVAPNGTGDVQLNADTVRVGDADALVLITSNGTGSLKLNTNAGTNSGHIQINSGANGAIDITPDGTGEVNIPKVDIDSGTVDAITSLTIANNVDLGNYTVRANNFLADSHTATRVFFAGTDGVLTSDSDFTFATDTLTVTKLGAFEAAGAIDFSDEAMTNVNIDSGDIASGVTINGNAATATTATLASTITVVDSTDTSSFIAMFDSATGSLAAKTDAGLTYNSGTGMLTATGFTGPLTGNVTGNIDAVDGDFDGTLEADAITVDGTALNEYIADTVGAMVNSNTESGITVAYQDGDNTLDFTIGTLNQDTTGTAATVTGAAQTNITSLGTLTALTVDNVAINGTTIGHTNDTDLITLADGNVTIAGELDLITLDVSGNADIDGTLEADAITVDGTALNEYIADTIGAMVTSNTESGITVAYEDGDNTLDFTVGTLNQDTTGTAAIATAVTITDNESTNEENAVIFAAGGDVDGGNLGLESDGNLTYNPSTGTLTATTFSGSVSGSISTATESTTMTVTANNSTDETVYPIFVDGATGAQGAETDTGLTYNPSSGLLTITGELDAGSLDISGNADIDGTLEADAITVDGTALNEYIADTIGGMVTSNTESGITVAYQDGDNTLDFTVGTLNQDTTGNADTATVATTVTITDNENTNENNAIIFTAGGDLDGGNLGLESDGDFHYNPSTGTLTATTFSGAFSGTVTDATNITVSANNSTDETVYPTFVDGATGTQGIETDTGLTYNPSSGLFTISGELDAGSLDISGNADIDGTLEADAYTVDGTALNEYIADTVGAMVGSNTETGIAVTYEDGDNTLDFVLGAAQTTITSVYNASLKMGRDADNLIDFATTDNKIILRVNGVDEVELVENALSPVTSDGVALGTTSLMWSDLFLASGSVINFNNGDVTLTHSGNTLTVAGGTLAAAAITGTTIDASTDFTIGDTVITNGVITDSSGLSIAAAVDLGANTLTSTGSMQIRTIDYSDGDLAITIADGGGITAAAGITSTAAANTLGATSFNDANITNVGSIALDTITSDGSNIGFGTDGSGEDVYFYSATSGDHMFWDASDEKLVITGTNGQNALEVPDGNVTITDNLTVSGDFTVSGSSTQVNTTNLTVTDPLIKLAQGTTASPANDLGIIFTRGNGSSTNIANRAILWDESADVFVFANTNDEAGTTTGNVDIDDYASIRVGAITADDNSTFTGTITAATGSTIGNLTLANGSITDSSGAIDFGNETLTTTGVITAGGFTIGSAAILEAELEILDGATVTTAELNLIDGDTARGTTAVASGDGILINDAGTMRMTNVDTVSTYFASHNVGGGNIVTTGALATGSIASGFGTISTGNTITTTAKITGGELDIDDVIINGATIGHTDDTDLITVADGLVTVAGEISVTTLDIGGTNVSSTAAELNYNDTGQSVGTVVASKTVTVDSNKDVSSFRNITLTGELDAATLDLSSSADIAGDLVLSGGADGALQFTNAGENSIKIPDNQASALIIEEDNNAYMTFNTSNSSEAITIAKATTFSAAVDLGSNTLTSTGSMQIRTIDYSDGDLAMTIADGGKVTFAAGFAVGSDAAGDILYHNGTSYVRLAKGTADQVLTMNDGATAPGWEDASGGGTTINNATANELVTVASTTTELDAEANLTFDPASLLTTKSAGSSISGLNSHLNIQDTTTDAGGTGPTLLFSGWTNGTTNAEPFAAIGGYKDNSTNDNDDGYMGFYTRSNGSNLSTTERMRITSTGKVGIGPSGASNPAWLLDITSSGGESGNTTGNDPSMAMFLTQSSTNSHHSIVSIGTSKHASKGTYSTGIADGYGVGELRFVGSEASGSELQVGAYIKALANQAWSSGNNGTDLHISSENVIFDGSTQATDIIHATLPTHNLTRNDTDIDSGEILGSIQYRGNHGSSTRIGGKLQMFADGNWGSDTDDNPTSFGVYLETEGNTSAIGAGNSDPVFYVPFNGSMTVRNADATSNTNAIGKLRFQGASDANGVMASIEGVLEGDADNAAVKITTRATADNYEVERLRIGPLGQIGIAGTNYGNDGQVLSSGGSSGIVSWEDAGGAAFSVFTQYRYKATLTGTNATLTNWELANTSPQEGIGDGSSSTRVEESSGIFTFPSTGYWWVIFRGGYEAASDGTCQTGMKVSTDNGSNYTHLSNAAYGNNDSSATGGEATMDSILKVENVSGGSTVKIKFDTSSMASGSSLLGWEDGNNTSATFIKLKDV